MSLQQKGFCCRIRVCDLLHTCRHVPLHHIKLTGSLDTVASVQWSLTILTITILTITILTITILTITILTITILTITILTITILTITIRPPNVRINLLTVKIQYDFFSVPEFGLEFEGQLAVCQIINSLEGTSIGV